MVPVQQPRDDRVGDEARERDGHHAADTHLARVGEPLPGLVKDPGRDDGDRQPVDQGREDLPAVQAVGVAIARRARREHDRRVGEAERGRVEQHVERVGEQRQRGRPDPAGEFEDEDAERQGDRQPQLGGRGPVTVPCPWSQERPAWS